MSSMRSLRLLRTTRPRFSCPHPLCPNPTTTRLSSPPSPFYHSHHNRRSYHWQTGLGTAIEGTQTLLLNLHSTTGLPWFLTIPLVAFTIGAVFRLPFQVYTQHILQKRAELGPLLQGWNTRLQTDVADERVPRREQMFVVKQRQEAVLRRIYRKLGLQEWRLYSSVSSLPLWLLAIESVRRLCGGHVGLLGLFMDGFAEETTDAAPSIPASEVPADGLSSAAETITHTAAAAAIDPSLTIEGCLWFTDLTVPDPYHILPMLLSVSLVYNLLPKSEEQFSDRVRVAFGLRPKSARAQTLAEADYRIRSWERAKAIFYVALVGVGTMLGPLTLNLPAALHLYWLTSSLTNAGFSKALKLFMPVKSNLRRRCTGSELPVIRPRRGLRAE
ncbi:hypothetical protein F4803DRAFT_239827 [Xylaria telfairii]|nr:hypothetical protein F4803DRAFT_239827 [Xylaria telfairii]